MDFKVVDNSGVTMVYSIGNLVKRKNNLYKIGDIIICVVKKIISFSKLKISNICKALIIRLKRCSLFNKLYFSFKDNAVVLLDKNNNFIGTRIFGPILSYKDLTNKIKLNKYYF